MPPDCDGPACGLRATYRGVMPDEFLDAMDSEQSERWKDVLLTLPDDQAVAVADPGNGSIAGFAIVGPEREGELIGELFAINCHPDWIGRGVGQALLDWADGELVRLGHQRAVLWVVDSNDRARRFYERNGWAPDGGARTVEIGGASVPEVRYAKDLAAPD
jgi:GNAT superfamily N-acetyltransferase